VLLYVHYANFVAQIMLADKVAGISLNRTNDKRAQLISIYLKPGALPAIGP